jgi:predicted lipoprotein with Yx(FWY)xxD motif
MRATSGPGSLRLVFLVLPVVALALALTACGSDGDQDGTTEQAVPATAGSASGGAQDASGEMPGEAAPATMGTKITTGDSQFGEVLFDGDRRAIYYFDKEKTSASECYGACAAAWPPVLTDGRPVSGGGAQMELLGSTKRDDGSTQVTYDGRPLYYYVDDPPGEVICHNVDEFGGLWLAVQPDGAPVP